MNDAAIRDLVAKMTLEEKASLCSGKNFWNTKAVDRLGIRSWMMTDGPHGLRKQAASADHLGLNASVPATCFPTFSGLAATWNRELVSEIGRALAEECQAEEVGVLLGPGVNIKRSPLCGRNFEYFSEDPYLAGQLAKAYIQGVQSGGVGTSLKHFAANNQEKLRMAIDTIVDERTLREIYLPAFETAVTEGKPWTVMCAYNKLNGTYCSQNNWLLRKVLKEEWGYDGLVVTDWGACDDRAAGVAAGQDLEMPNAGPENDQAVLEAVKSRSLSEKDLDEAVERNLRLYFRVMENRRSGIRFDAEKHHALARKAAAEACVLLKNEGETLPLKKAGKIAVLGAFAKTPRYQGNGSSLINPTRLDCAWDAAQAALAGKAELAYAPGYDLATPKPDAALLEEARRTAAAADVSLVFIGLTSDFESEGFDRTHIGIPESHAALLRAAVQAGKKTVVVLSNGAPIEMPWLSRTDAVLESYLGGQAGGSAVIDILFGDAEPSGRLAETFPLRLEDNPSYLNFPGGKDAVEYREGIFVGYRHYDSLNAPVLFPFGFGLSYTKFEYSDLRLDRGIITDADTLTARVTVANVGARRGKEVVQLYVRDEEASVVRPRKELKAFEKLELAPGERKTVSFSLDKRAFAFWDSGSGAWRAESGRFTVLVGSSVTDIRLSGAVVLEELRAPRRAYNQSTVLGDLLALPEFAELAGPLVDGFRSALGITDGSSPMALMMEAMFRELPLRNLTWLGGGAFTRESIRAMIDVANGVQPASILGRFFKK